MSYTMASGLPIHGIAFLSPEASQDDYDSLELSIKEKGVLEPVTTWKDETGKLVVIDGRTRATIADNLCIEYPTVEFVGDERAAVTFARDKNISRRHLTSVQKAAVILDSDRYLLGRGLSHNSAEQKATARERDETMRKHGIGDVTRRRVQKVIESKPELLEALKSGAMSARQAHKAIEEVKRGVEELKAEEAESDEETGLLSKMKAWNAKIDQDCRKLKGMLASLVEGRDESRAAIIEGRMNALCADLKHDKAHAECGYCDGVGCKRCGERGWLNKVDADSVPESKRREKVA
jgi:ParB-like chromosome segregation protein Spo0J